MVDELIKKRIITQLRPGKTALVVVDIQNDFCHVEGVFGKKGFDLSHVEGAVNNLLPFIAQCRQLGMPVVFVRTIHSEWTDSDPWIGRLGGAGKQMMICRPDTWGAEFYKVQPQAGDFITTKHRFSGFVGTDLDLVLRGKGMQTLVFTGFTSNVCVETTARDAFNRNYYVIFVDDCCEAPLPGEHESAIHNISNYFGLVADSKTVLSVLEHKA